MRKRPRSSSFRSGEGVLGPYAGLVELPGGPVGLGHREQVSPQREVRHGARPLAEGAQIEPLLELRDRLAPMARAHVTQPEEAIDLEDAVEHAGRDDGAEGPIEVRHGIVETAVGGGESPECEFDPRVGDAIGELEFTGQDLDHLVPACPVEAIAAEPHARGFADMRPLTEPEQRPEGIEPFGGESAFPEQPAELHGATLPRRIAPPVGPFEPPVEPCDSGCA